MKTLLINNNTSNIGNLHSLLERNNLSFLEIDRKEISFVNTSQYNFIILSGSYNKSIIGNESDYKEEIELIKNTNSPILGICMGFELIAYAFESELRVMNSRRKGIINLEIIKKSRLFKGIRNYKVYENHKWIVKKLSDSLIGLAKSTDGYEIIKHKTLSVFGFQFHPEVFSNKTCGNKIFNNLLNLIKNA